MATNYYHCLSFCSILLALCLFVHTASSDVESDKNECASTLAGLATCLPYVQSNDVKTPTPDCCNGLEGLIQKSRKCLCLLIKDRNDPDLGLKVNITRALNLPTVCKVAANLSDCPRLLNLSASSPDAQIFEQGANSTTSQGNDSSPTAKATAGSPIPSNSPRNGRTRSPHSLSAFGKLGSVVRVQEMIVTVSVLLLVPFLLFT